MLRGDGKGERMGDRQVNEKETFVFHFLDLLEFNQKAT